MKLFSNACLNKEDIKIRSMMLKKITCLKISPPAGSAVDFLPLDAFVTFFTVRNIKPCHQLNNVSLFPFLKEPTL